MFEVSAFHVIRFCFGFPETLRLWSPGAFLDRICEKDYNLGKANSKSTKDYIVSILLNEYALQYTKL